MSVPVTVIVPTLPERSGAMLDRCIDSIAAQTVDIHDGLFGTDYDGLGPAVIRQRLVADAHSEWVAFLDDDDEFMPGHIEALYSAALAHEADYVFSWYEVVGGTDPRAAEFGLPWDSASPRQTTITTLVRRSLVLDTGGFLPDGGDDLDHPARIVHGEDWRFTQRANDAGASIFHLPVKTWRWHHWTGNTSGLPRRRKGVR